MAPRDENDSMLNHIHQNDDQSVVLSVELVTVIERINMIVAEDAVISAFINANIDSGNGRNFNVIQAGLLGMAVTQLC